MHPIKTRVHVFRYFKIASIVSLALCDPTIYFILSFHAVKPREQADSKFLWIGEVCSRRKKRGCRSGWSKYRLCPRTLKFIMFLDTEFVQHHMSVAGWM